MKLFNWTSYTALFVGVGLIALAGGRPASAQSWSGASPFIVGTADHGFADRPSGDFSFIEGSASKISDDVSEKHSHIKLSNETMEELGAMIGLGLLGMSAMNSSHSSPESVARFASVLPPAGYSASLSSGNRSSGSSSLTVAPVPEFGTGASFGIMAMLGVAGMSVSRRRRRHAA